MFDIGFAELLLIAVVGLLVIGPERLPAAIRTGSAWLNRLRRGFNELKHEVQRELHNDEVMQELRKTSESVRKETQRWREDLTGPGEKDAQERAGEEAREDMPSGQDAGSAGTRASGERSRNAGGTPGETEDARGDDGDRQ
ncbi:MAG: Sec-independent protein translocase protein TatB [Pseudohaliea sp.]